jgi:hypothetical protein
MEIMMGQLYNAMKHCIISCVDRKARPPSFLPRPWPYNYQGMLRMLGGTTATAML